MWPHSYSLGDLRTNFTGNASSKGISDSKCFNIHFSANVLRLEFIWDYVFCIIALRNIPLPGVLYRATDKISIQKERHTITPTRICH